jgi:hypothetical protein
MSLVRRDRHRGYGSLQQKRESYSVRYDYTVFVEERTSTRQVEKDREVKAMRGLTQEEIHELRMNMPGSLDALLPDESVPVIQRLIARGLIRTWIGPSPRGKGWTSDYYETTPLGIIALACQIACNTSIAA